jgi:hypothetical protein
VHQAANILASLEFIDQVAAQQIGPMAEAVANMFMVVYYQAETGRATPADFQEAMDGLKQALPVGTSNNARFSVNPAAQR